MLGLRLLLLLLLLLLSHLLVYLPLVLLVLCTRVALCHPCMMRMHSSRGRTRLGYRVPRAGRGSKVGVRVRPKICVLFQRWRQGQNFRPAGGVRGQVAGSLPRRQPGAGTRQHRVGVVTPSFDPEVPDTRFVSRGRGLGIRESMGWTKVCETVRSGFGCYR